MGLLTIFVAGIVTRKPTLDKNSQSYLKNTVLADYLSIQLILTCFAVPLWQRPPSLVPDRNLFEANDVIKFNAIIVLCYAH